jgi:hypothetical protein
MAAFLNEQFSGVSGDTLETYNPGGWAKVAASSGAGGTMGISSTQRARQTTTTTGNSVYYKADAPAPSADYTVSADIYIVTGGTNTMGICGRCASDTVTMYRASVSGSTLVLTRSVDNSAITLGSVAYTQVTGAQLHIDLVMQGSQISVKQDGVTVIGPVTDTAVTSAGYIGMRAVNSGAGGLQVDNLTADTFAVGGVDGTAVPAGVSAAAGVGTATVSAGGRASPAGVGAVASVGTANASAGSSATATPAGVSASASVGAATAGGSANIAPAGVTASASVGQATAYAGTTIPANATLPFGVGAVASVGTATASGTANASPAGVTASASVGSVIAAGTIRLNGAASPLGVTAYAYVGIVTARSGELFARAPSGSGYAPQRNEHQSRPAQIGGGRPSATQENYR